MNNATENVKKLDALIKKSFSIALVAHSSPDPDAISSLVALSRILKANYPHCEVFCTAESIPQSLSFMPGFSEVTNGQLLPILQTNAIDLVIMLDFNARHMVSKMQSEAIYQEAKKQGIAIAIIDHHEEKDVNIEYDCYVRLNPTSTAMNLYMAFHEILGLPLTAAIAAPLLYGIVADTNRFRNGYGTNLAEVLAKTAKIVEAAETTIEEVSIQLERNSPEMLQVMSYFLQNIVTIPEQSAAYTFLTENDFDAHELSKPKLGEAATYVVNNIITHVGDSVRGFLIYPHFQESGKYTVRFRSDYAEKPVIQWAQKLGGGGHAQSAAARIHATSIEEALEIVLSVIKDE
jgi:phosphoesterase RecJ-like protein